MGVMGLPRNKCARMLSIWLIVSLHGGAGPPAFRQVTGGNAKGVGRQRAVSLELASGHTLQLELPLLGNVTPSKHG
jgi:hypothetical protein